MNLEYRLTIKDHLEANQAHFKSQPFLYITVWGISLLCMIAGLFYLTFAFILIGADLIKGCLFIVLGLSLTAFGTFCNPYLNLLQRYAIARAYKSQPDSYEPRTLEVTKEGLIVKLPSFQSTSKWRDYTHFIETKNLFMVYQGRQVSNLFPKRAFSSVQQISEFRERLEENIGKSEERLMGKYDPSSDF